MHQSPLKHIRSFLKTARRPLIVILGPTASGKTQLGLSLASAFNGEIVSADSRQVYRHLNIGTDKIPIDKRKNIPHHLMDVVEPTERFTLVDYKRLSERAIDEILEKSRIPFLVGGTGLYIRAVTDNYSLPAESQNLEIRKKFEDELRRDGKETLHARLAMLDPESAKKIHPNNIPYLLRALEIVETTGCMKRGQKSALRYDILKIGLNVSRSVLYERINARVDTQMRAGLLEETKSLLSKFPANLPAFKTLGYQELIPHLNGDSSLEKAVTLIKQNTRHFAKRQTTWWRREHNVVWITPEAS